MRLMTWRALSISPYLGARRPSQVQAHLMQQRLAAEQRWMLGSTTSMAPAEVMTEIFRVLRNMNVSW